MGEPSHSFASGYIWSPVMRSSRGKLFVYLAVLGGMCFVVFLLSNAHSSLKQLEGANEKCQQQQDSLSAQLQVVYEHKSRLEKSLQQEKSEHKRSKEEIEKQLQQEETRVQQEKEKERTLENRVSQLKSTVSKLEEEKNLAESAGKEQLQALQVQKDAEMKQLQDQITELLADKEKLEQEKGTLAWKMEQQMNEATLCQLQYQQLNQKLDECTKQLSKKESLSSLHIYNQDDTKNAGQKVSPVATPSSKDKSNVLDRPHLLKGDVDNKPSDGANKDTEVKNQIENIADVRKSKHNASEAEKVPPAFNGQDDLREDAKVKELSDNDIHGDLQKRQEPDNLPQVQPPLNNPAERGEYVNGDQLEQPQFKGSNDLKKDPAEAQNLNDLKAAQVRDMMVKSPADGNVDGVDPQHLPPLHDFGGIAQMKNNYPPNLMKERAELPVGDKHYADEDDDDQDGENEDDPMGNMQGAHVKGFREQDFDAQDTDNKDAVMVAPR